MEANEHTIKLYYNTEVEKLKMPEYGRNVLKMVEDMKAEPDREKRSRQAAGIVRVMELLNPQVHQQENFAQKLWDHLYLIAGLDLDIDAPYPAPEPEASPVTPSLEPTETESPVETPVPETPSDIPGGVDPTPIREQLERLTQPGGDV